nr:MAG TPA: hypothetical protein [Bacteriophage sp.]
MSFAKYGEKISRRNAAKPRHSKDDGVARLL